MTPYTLNLLLAIGLVLWAIAEPESLFGFGAKLEAYAALAWGYLTLAPSLVRMILVQKYMLWKMRRQLRIAMKPKQ